MTTPQKVANTLEELNKRYTLVIAEIVNTYPNYKANPKFNSYGDAYERNMGNLHKLQEEFFSFKNSLSKDVSDLQNNITRIDEMLYELEEDLKIKREEYAYLKNSDNAAHGRLSDSNTLYKQQLLGNILILITFSGFTYKLLTNI